MADDKTQKTQTTAAPASPKLFGLEAAQALSDGDEIASWIAHRVNGGHLGPVQGDMRKMFDQLPYDAVKRLLADAHEAELVEDDSDARGVGPWLRAVIGRAVDERAAERTLKALRT